MEIKTERLRIYTSSDGVMKKIIEDETDGEMKKAYTEMLDGALLHPDRREWYAITLIELTSGERIGDLCFKGLEADGSAEIGYGICEKYQGQGYATEAVAAAAAWALRQPGVTRVYAETDPGNVASQKVLKKCGFIPTGDAGDEGPRFVKTI